MNLYDDEGWCGDEPEPINSGHYHELLDRTFMFATMLDEFISNHPATDKEMHQHCAEAIMHIMMIHTLSAKKLYLE